MYLHYFAIHAEDEVGKAYKELNRVKNEVIQDSLESINNDAMQTMNMLKQDLGYDENFAAKIASGEAFMEAIEKANKNVELNIDDVENSSSIIYNGIEAALGEHKIKMSELNNLGEDISKQISECISIAEAYVGNYSFNKQLVSDIIQQIVYNNKKYRKKDKSEIGQQIIRDMMDGSKRGDLFTFHFEQRGSVRQDLTRIITMLYALGAGGGNSESLKGSNGELLGGTASYTHSSGKVEEKTYQEAIIHLLQAWGKNLKATLYEIAKLRAALKVEGPFLKAHKQLFDRIEVSGSGTGTHEGSRTYVQERLKQDKGLEELYTKAEDAYKAVNRKSVNKADANVQFVTSEGSVKGTLSISAKKHEQMKLSADGNVIEKATFHSVGGTPLSSLFIRDTTLDSGFLHNFLQVATVHTASYKNGSKWQNSSELTSYRLNQYFNDYLNVIKTAALYRSVVGEMAGHGDMMMRIGNGSDIDIFVPASKVLRAALQDTTYVTTTMRRSAGLALERSTFEAANEWEKGPNNNDRSEDAGSRRSAEALSIMYKIKVGIEFNLSEFDYRANL